MLSQPCFHAEQKLWTIYYPIGPASQYLASPVEGTVDLRCRMNDSMRFLRYQSGPTDEVQPEHNHPIILFRGKILSSTFTRFNLGTITQLFYSEARYKVLHLQYPKPRYAFHLWICVISLAEKQLSPVYMFVNFRSPCPSLPTVVSHNGSPELDVRKCSICRISHTSSTCKVCMWHLLL